MLIIHTLQLFLLAISIGITHIASSNHEWAFSIMIVLKGKNAPFFLELFQVSKRIDHASNWEGYALMVATYAMGNLLYPDGKRQFPVYYSGTCATMDGAILGYRYLRVCDSAVYY